MLTPVENALRSVPAACDRDRARVHPDRTGRRARSVSDARNGSDLTCAITALRGLCRRSPAGASMRPRSLRGSSCHSPSRNSSKWRLRAYCRACRPSSDVAARLLVEPGVLVTGDVQEADLDAADGVDEVLEAGEVDLDDVVDRDPELLRDRGGQHVGAVAVRRVDAVLGRSARRCHPQVARQADQRRRRCRPAPGAGS